MLVSGLVALAVSGAANATGMFTGAVMPMPFRSDAPTPPMMGEPAMGSTSGAPSMEMREMRIPLPPLNQGLEQNTFFRMPSSMPMRGENMQYMDMNQSSKPTMSGFQDRTTGMSQSSKPNGPGMHDAASMKPGMNASFRPMQHMESSNTADLQKEIAKLQKQVTKMEKAAKTKEASMKKKLDGRVNLLQKKAAKTADADLKQEYLDAITEMQSDYEDWLDEFRLTTEEQTDDLKARIAELQEAQAEAEEVQ